MSDWLRNAIPSPCACCAEGPKPCGEYTPFLEYNPGAGCSCSYEDSGCVVPGCGLHPTGSFPHCGDRLSVHVSAAGVGGIILQVTNYPVPSGHLCPTGRTWYSEQCLIGSCGETYNCPYDSPGGDPAPTSSAFITWQVYLETSCESPACGDFDCAPNCEYGSCCYVDNGVDKCIVSGPEACTELDGDWDNGATCYNAGCSSEYSSCSEACCVDMGWPWGILTCTIVLSVRISNVFVDVNRSCPDDGTGDGTNCFAHSFFVSIGTAMLWSGLPYDGGVGYFIRVDMPCGTKCWSTAGASKSIIACTDSCDPRPCSDAWRPCCDTKWGCDTGCCPGEMVHPCHVGWEANCGGDEHGGRCDSIPNFSIQQYHTDNAPPISACCCGSIGDLQLPCIDYITEIECGEIYNGTWVDPGDGDIIMCAEANCPDCNP